MPTAYKRVLLKLSGEALMGDDAFGINRATIERMVADVAEVVRMGTQLAVVIGGGNIFRGVAGGAAGMDRATADYMGMLATMMNALALQDAMRHAGIEARVQSALRMDQVVEPYIRPRAIRQLEEGKVVIFAAGTGNPFFTTDTAAALRGSEIGAEVVLKATKVDGVYSADPKKDPSATRYSTISFDEAIGKNLQVMDATAFALCRDQKLPIRVFSINQAGRAQAHHSGRGRRYARPRVNSRGDKGARAGAVPGNCAAIAGTARNESSEAQMSVADIRKSVDQKMQKSIEAFKNDLAKIRTGRAHTGLLDHIQVDYYGSSVPISQVANMTLIDARTIGVQAWEKKMVPVVEKAIRDSDLGLNPSNAGRPDPRADARADRRAPPRTDEGRQERRRKRQDRGAQPAPRRQRATEEAREGQGNLRGRRTSCKRRRPEADRQKRRGNRQAGGVERSRNHDGLRPFPVSCVVPARHSVDT